MSGGAYLGLRRPGEGGPRAVEWPTETAITRQGIIAIFSFVSFSQAFSLLLFLLFCFYFSLLGSGLRHTSKSRIGDTKNDYVSDNVPQVSVEVCLSLPSSSIEL